MAQREAGQAAKSVSELVRRMMDEGAQRNLVGIVANTSPLEVHIANGSHSLREDENLLLSHGVRRYDYDHGLEEGDSVLLIPAGDDFVATAVMSGKDNEIVGYQELVAGSRTDVMFGVSVDGDSRDRFEVLGDGTIRWGAGSGSPDTTLYRKSAGVLKTDGVFEAGSLNVDSFSIDSVQSQDVWVDPNDSGGKLYFGSAKDTRMYRSGAANLKTDGTLRVGQSLVVDTTDATSKLYFGSALDTNLYRLSATRLATDGSIAVAGSKIILHTDGGLYFGPPSDTVIYRAAAAQVRTNSAILADSSVYGHYASTVGRVAIGDMSIFTGVGPSRPGIGFHSSFDTQLYRNTAAVLRTDADLFIGAALADTQPQIRLTRNYSGGSPGIEFGPGGTTAPDTFFRRSAPGFLSATGTSIIAGGYLRAIGGVYVDAGDTQAQLAFGSALDTGLYRKAAHVLVTNDVLLVGGNASVPGTPQPRSSVEVWMTANSLITIGEESEGSANPALTFYRTGAGLASGSAMRIWRASFGRGLVFQSDSGNKAYGAEIYTTLLEIDLNGRLMFGPEGAQDAILYRSAANQLQTSGAFMANGNVYANAGSVSGQILLSSNGAIYFGSAGDTYLYRSAANQLTMSGQFIVTTNMLAVGDAYGQYGTAYQVRVGNYAGYAGLLFGAAGDANLYRVAAATLQTTGAFTTGAATTTLGSTSAGAGTYQGPGGTFASVRSAAGLAFTASTMGDTGTYRYQVESSGKVSWGDGTVASVDTNLYRAAAANLKTDGRLDAAGDIYAQANIANYVGIGALGPGGQAALRFGADTSLYRALADVLATDDRLLVAGAQVAGDPFGLQVGPLSSSLPMHYQGFISGGAHGYIGHNSWMGSDTLFRWDGTHASFGSRGILFNYGGVATGITFYADNLATTAGSTFTPLARMTIRNDGDVQVFNKLLVGGDTNLYRSAADVLKTDDTFHIGPGQSLVLNNGGTAAAAQIEFAYYGANRLYRHFIQTQHNGSDTPSNVMDFNIWTLADTAAALASVRVLRLTGDGKLVIGNATDTNLYRFAASFLATAGDFATRQGSLSQVSLQASGSVPVIYFGNAQDTNLYRSAADTLKTDDNFVVGGNLTVTGSLLGTTPGALPSDSVVAAATRLIANKLVGTDTQPSWRVMGDGKQEWGQGGTTVPDVTMYRYAAADMRIESTVRIGIGTSMVSLGGAAGASPNIYFGNAFDTNLYRAAASQLRTSSSFVVDGAISAGGGNPLGMGAVVGGGTYTAANNWMIGYHSGALYYDGTNWQNKTSGGNNGWALIGLNGASGGFDFYTTPATGAADRSYTPAQLMALRKVAIDSNGVFSVGTTLSIYPSAGTPNAGKINFGDGSGWRLDFTNSSGANRVLAIHDNGTIGFGPSSAESIYRPSAGQLNISAGIAAGYIYSNAGGASQVLLSGGNIYIGSANDVYIYRYSANTLGVANSLVVSGDMILLNAASRFRTAGWLASSVGGSYVGKLPIYTESNVLIGYIPIYQS